MTKFLFKITTIITFSTITIFASAYSDSSIINSYQSGTNEVYQAQYNSSGAILINQSLQRIYLGKDCDAYSSKYGKGTWGQANGGYIISFKAKEFSFPRQEVRMLMKTNCPL
ncbi:hypothetical protein [Psychrobacter sp. JCM 18903]|uniref:hypothetical protein n=1 Tax=Psychrobacter sp. JCM 18903 TaxID=1298610 RepID=UPI0005ED6C15|nr:hypothetical protein [Psychrobacter sp. JCM 18903]